MPIAARAVDTPTRHAQLFHLFIALTTAGLVSGATLVSLKHGLHADDAWMFVRYADRWLKTGEVAWNPDLIPTFGLTSPLHECVVLLIRALGVSIDMTLRVAVLLPALALLALIRGTLSRRGLGVAASLCGLVGILLVGSSRMVIEHLSSGMDTALAVLACYMLTTAAIAVLRRPTRSSWGWFVAAGLVAMAARPDALLIVVGLLVALTILDGRHLRVGLAGSVAGLIAVGALTLLIIDGHFGRPLPLPFYVKTRPIYEQLSATYDSLPREGLLTFLEGTTVLIAGVAMMGSQSTITLTAVPVALFTAYCFRITWIMGYEARFFMPLLGLLMATFIQALKDQQDRRSATRVLLVGRAYAAVCVALIGVTFVSASRASALHRPARGALRVQQPFYFALSNGLANMDDRIVIASTEHGYLGAVNPNKTIIDLAGLHDPLYANGFVADDLFRRAPDLIIMPRRVYRGMIDEIERHPSFQQYVYLSRDHAAVAKATESEQIGIAIRRNSPDRTLLEAVTIQATDQPSR